MTQDNDRSALTAPNKQLIALTQSAWLNALRQQHIAVSIFLLNGVKLSGVIESFDPYAIMLYGKEKKEAKDSRQLILKGSAATILPSRDPKLEGVEARFGDGSLQDIFLRGVHEADINAAVYLINGIKLRGQIAGADQYAFFLGPEKGTSAQTQMVYKHAVSTVVPSELITLPNLDGSWESA